MSKTKNNLSTPPEVEQFLEMLTSEIGASNNTVLSYLNDISNFYHFLVSHNSSLLEASQANIESYLSHLSRLGLSDRTRARRLSALRTLYGFLLREKKIDSNPTKLLTQLKRRRKLPKFLSEQETETLINAAYNSSHPDRLRRSAFIELLYATGMRISELLNVRLSDIEWQEECILVKGKGNKQRLVPFNQSTRAVLSTYIRSLPFQSEWLFPSHNLKKPLTRQRFFQIIKELAISAGLDPLRVSPHVIRHAFATHLLNHGANLINVQKLLGHADIAATEIYTHVLTERLKETVFTYHPLASKNNKA